MTSEFLLHGAAPASLPRIVRAGESDCLELPGEGRAPLLESRHTGGALALARTKVARGAGAPLHLHTREDELFWVESGEFELHLGGQSATLGPGDFAFSPRGVPHSHTSLRDGGTLLVAAVRAGSEGFFRDVARRVDGLLAPLPRSEVAALALGYGVHVGAPEELARVAWASAPPKVVRAQHGEAAGAPQESERGLLSLDESGGMAGVVESQTPSLCGPPESVHAGKDVAFAILAGRYEFCLDDARVQASPGDVLWVPSGTPHAFRVVSPQDGRALVLSIPR